MSNEQNNQTVTWVKILSQCYDCGQDMECYGPFDTEKEADNFEDFPEDSFSGMTCITTKVVPLVTERRNSNES